MVRCEEKEMFVSIMRLSTQKKLRVTYSVSDITSKDKALVIQCQSYAKTHITVVMCSKT